MSQLPGNQELYRCFVDLAGYQRDHIAELQFKIRQLTQQNQELWHQINKQKPHGQTVSPQPSVSQRN